MLRPGVMEMFVSKLCFVTLLLLLLLLLPGV
jgi:hypothetical protein